MHTSRTIAGALHPSLCPEAHTAQQPATPPAPSSAAPPTRSPCCPPPPPRAAAALARAPTSRTATCTTVTCRVPPSGHTPQGSGWRATQHGAPSQLNSAFLDTEVLHRRYAVCSPAHLTVASARTWRLHSTLLCSHRRVVPVGRERGQGRALRASPRPSPWNHQRHWSSSRSHQLVRISGHHLCRTRGSPQLDADRQQYAAASPPATHPHAALTVSSHIPPRVP
jgi:hypothetical protein